MRNAFRRHLRSTVLVPGMVAVVVPTVINSVTRSVRVGWGLDPPFNWFPPVLGLALIGLGVLLVSRTVALFAKVGDGTLAPWDPPRNLVVRGPYRYVRNPMVSGGLCVIVGEAIFLGSVPLLGWFLMLLVINATYIRVVEEPALAKRFGEEYATYAQHVPRWIPRRDPWPRRDEP
jgi:protein-S-isoprenylcysteine O-methyltransferase Ste14